MTRRDDLMRLLDKTIYGRRHLLAAVACLSTAATLSACQEGQRAASVVTPTAAQVAKYYDYSGDLSVDMNGNVAEVTVSVDQDEYRMGGRVWAMAAPYIFLFSSATENALRDYGGLGGVRVRIRYSDGAIVSQALLDRNELNEATWPRALHIAGLARTQGTDSPGYMRDLVRWGEDHTDFEYNPDYIKLP